MTYDVAIVGAGVVGGLIARELSRYQLNVALLEKCNDVAMGTTKANSAIVHGGFDAQNGTLKAELNVKGTAMMPELCEKLSVPFKKNGSVVVAFSDSEMEHIKVLYDRGIKNGVPGLSVIDQAELRRIEPNISDKAVGALLCESAGIVCPYELTIAAVENAVTNGVEFIRNCNVTAIEDNENGYTLKTSLGDISAKYIINAAGNFSDDLARMVGDNSIEIIPRKGEYYLLDKSVGNLAVHTIFQCPNEMGKGILVSPTVDGNLLVGPTAEDIDDKESSLGYIIRIADGTFVIIDGGEYIDGVEVRMYEILKKIAPDPNNIVISAWMITHAHSDHVGGFVKFANKYANDKTIRLKQFIFNFPHDSKVVNSWDVDSQDLARQGAKKFGAEMLKVHTGNVLYYADIKINILYTQENYLSANANGIMSNYNGSSIVTQFVMADGTKVLVGADHPVDGIYEGANWCENALVKCYGTALESKVVSTFHHGYGGGANNVIYGVIRPKIVLWSVDNARITASSTPLTAVSHNAYFTTNGKANGVTYYTAGGSSVTILQFANGNPSIKYYKTFAEFKAS